MSRTRQESLRLGILFVVVCAFFVIAVARLVHLQIYKSAEYSAIVDRQSSGKIPIPASRGILYDRNGQVVANNVVASSLYAWADSRRELRSIASYLEDIYHLPAGSAVRKYGLEVRKFRWIDRHMDDALAARVENDAPEGLYIRQETERDYPFDTIGKQILGFTDIDGKGQSGLELQYDSVLAGQKGFADIRRDGLRNTFRVKESALVKPIPGQSIVLTVDWRLQEILEEELRDGVIDYHAKSGMAVLLNCNNGEILAAAHFDPNEKHPDRPLKLRPMTDQFEPGSIFKAVTAAGMLDAGIVNFDTTIDCENGKWKLGRRTLHDDKKHGLLTFREIIELSSNIGVAKWAIKEGGEEMYEAIKRFDIGSRTGLDWPGEATGMLSRPNRWSDYTIAALAMGHSVAVSPLQMADAMAAIANGGRIYQPRIVLGFVDDKGNVIDRTSSTVVNEAMQEASADTLRSILRGVVERGTAEAVNSEIVSIAGKTGTAQIPDVANHRYFWGKFMASFAGFFPAERPLVAGVVVLEDPQPIHYGGLTAGPIFRRIAERYTILNPDVFTVPDRMIAEQSRKFHNTSVVPDLLGHQLAQAKAMAEESGFELRTGADSGIVMWQFPPPDRLALENEQIIVLTKEDKTEKPRMANLKGLSIREVSAFLSLIGVDCVVQGNGRVVAQSIKPGETISENSVCRLECRPI
jgi:cell division protein FtsI/penicillin-binding protein 2